MEPWINGVHFSFICHFSEQQPRWCSQVLPCYQRFFPIKTELTRGTKLHILPQWLRVHSFCGWRGKEIQVSGSAVWKMARKSTGAKIWARQNWCLQREIVGASPLSCARRCWERRAPAFLSFYFGCGRTRPPLLARQSQPAPAAISAYKSQGGWKFQWFELFQH